MASSITGKTMPWFTISEKLSAPVTAATDIDVSAIAAVSFDVNVAVTIGTLTTAFALPAGTSIGIDATTATIRIDADAFMFAMAR